MQWVYYVVYFLEPEPLSEDKEFHSSRARYSTLRSWDFKPVEKSFSLGNDLPDPCTSQAGVHFSYICIWDPHTKKNPQKVWMARDV